MLGRLVRTNSPATISPVGPAPTITTACSAIPPRPSSGAGLGRRFCCTRATAGVRRSARGYGAGTPEGVQPGLREGQRHRRNVPAVVLSLTTGGMRLRLPDRPGRWPRGRFRARRGECGQPGSRATRFPCSNQPVGRRVALPKPRPMRGTKPLVQGAALPRKGHNLRRIRSANRTRL